jgi:hypothetical protein
VLAVIVTHRDAFALVSFGDQYDDGNVGRGPPMAAISLTGKIISDAFVAQRVFAVKNLERNQFLNVRLRRLIGDAGQVCGVRNRG